MSTRSSSPEYPSSRDESLSSKAPLMSDLEAQDSEPVHQGRQKCLKFSILSLVVLAIGCLGGSFAYANLSKFTADEKSSDHLDLPDEPLAASDEKHLLLLNPTVKEAIIGRWQERAKFNVSEYIDAENGPTFYKMFAKKMTADLEYELVDVNVYQTTFYVSWMPPLKYPLRLDQPYQHKSPSGDPVTSVAQFRPEFDDIFVNTQGGHEGPVTTRIQVIDGELILTSTMVEKNVSCQRIYTRRAP